MMGNEKITEINKRLYLSGDYRVCCIYWFTILFG